LKISFLSIVNVHLARSREADIAVATMTAT